MTATKRSFWPATGRIDRRAVEGVVAALDVEALSAGRQRLPRHAGDRDDRLHIALGPVDDLDRSATEFIGIGVDRQVAGMGRAVHLELDVAGGVPQGTGRQQQPGVLLGAGRALLDAAGGDQLQEVGDDAWSGPGFGRERQGRRPVAQLRAVVVAGRVGALVSAAKAASKAASARADSP
jgi:hypothetical protein